MLTLSVVYVHVDHGLNTSRVRAVVIVWQLDLQLPMQLVPITTKIVSLNPNHGKVYLIQHYVLKSLSVTCSTLAGLWFSPGTLVSSTNKTDCHDLAEILLKVTLNIITLTLFVPDSFIIHLIQYFKVVMVKILTLCSTVNTFKVK
jgi:hypothetical protein